MRFPDYFEKADDPVVTFEVFPPKTRRGMRNLRTRILPELVAHEPRCITVTYGAMGSTQDKTLEIATLIRNEFGVDSAHHLTCVGASRGEIEQTLSRIGSAGFRNIVALRGDQPQGSENFVAPRMDSSTPTSWSPTFRIPSRQMPRLAWPSPDTPRSTWRRKASRPTSST